MIGIDTAEEAIAVFSVLIALLAMGLSWFSILRTDKVVRADLIIRIDQEMRQFHDVHVKLRPGGEWSDEAGPQSAEEWARVDSYMGLFERIYLLMDQKLLKQEYVNRFYGYRYDNVADHPAIREQKLEKERSDWKDFIALGDKLDRTM